MSRGKTTDKVGVIVRDIQTVVWLLETAGRMVHTSGHLPVEDKRAILGKLKGARNKLNGYIQLGLDFTPQQRGE